MFYNLGKRIIDIIGSIFGLFIFAPVFLIIALFIKVVSPTGPVFADIPDRVGKNNSRFKMFKFRSMVPNAHEILKQDEELYKKYVANSYKLDSHEDPRIIKGGAFMRKSSLDEIPQFINVLFGNMSLVGPRAYYPYEIEEQKERYPESVKHLDEALSVKPGITGPWQIGGRSDIGFVERVKMDAEYAKTRSLTYDIKILLKTPYVVITGRGAV